MDTILRIYYALVFNYLNAIVVFRNIDMALPKKGGKPLINWADRRIFRQHDKWHSWLCQKWDTWRDRAALLSFGFLLVVAALLICAVMFGAQHQFPRYIASTAGE